MSTTEYHINKLLLKNVQNVVELLSKLIRSKIKGWKFLNQKAVLMKTFVMAPTTLSNANNFSLNISSLFFST